MLQNSVYFKSVDKEIGYTEHPLKLFTPETFHFGKVLVFQRILSLEVDIDCHCLQS